MDDTLILLGLGLLALSKPKIEEIKDGWTTPVIIEKTPYEIEDEIIQQRLEQTGTTSVIKTTPYELITVARWDLPPGPEGMIFTPLSELPEPFYSKKMEELKQAGYLQTVIEEPTIEPIIEPVIIPVVEPVITPVIGPIIFKYQVGDQVVLTDGVSVTITSLKENYMDSGLPYYGVTYGRGYFTVSETQIR